MVYADSDEEGLALFTERSVFFAKLPFPLILPVSGFAISMDSPIHDALGGFPSKHHFIVFSNVDKAWFAPVVLQAMYAVRPIRKYIRCNQLKLHEKSLCETVENTERRPFGHFLKIFVDSKNARENEVHYEPTEFLKRVFEHERFAQGRECDARRFLRFLLKEIDRSVSELNPKHDLDLERFGPMLEMRVRTKLDGQRSMTQDLESLEVLRLDKDFFRVWMDSDGVTRRFVRSPEVLIVSFEIFDDEGRRTERVVRNLEETVDLKDCDDKPVRYSLCSAIVHCGESVSKGHWVCVFKARDRWLVEDRERFFGLLGEEDKSRFFTEQEVPGLENTAVYLAFYQMEGDSQ